MTEQGEVTLFMWVCLFLGVFGWPLFFLLLDWIGKRWTLRKIRRSRSFDA